MFLQRNAAIAARTEHAMKVCAHCLLVLDGSFCNSCGGRLVEPTTVPALAAMVAAILKRVKEQLLDTGHHQHQKERPCDACTGIKAAGFDDIERAAGRVAVEQITRANADG